MGGDVRLVQGGRVDHGIHACHASIDERAIGDGPDMVRERCTPEVEADRPVTRARQRPHEALAEMPGTSGDEDGRAHTGLPLAMRL